MSQYWEGQKGGGPVRKAPPQRSAPKPKPVVKPPPAPAPAAPTATSSTAKAIVDNANRLGLTWIMRPATVTSLTSTSSAQSVSISYDGDVGSVTAVSVCGVVLPGTRVLAIQIPPSGNFVIGVIGGQTQSNLVAVSRMVLSPTYTVTAVETTVTGSEITVPGITGSWAWEVFATFDMHMTGAGTTQCFSRLVGPDGAEDAFASYGFTNIVNQRATVFQSYNGTNATGVPAFSLVAFKGPNVGTVVLESTHTTFLVKIYQ
jgi:hypothetical protein